MNITDNMRLLFFIFACIPVRLVYAYVQNTYTYLNFISGFIGIMFIYRWATWNGEKGAFGGVLWWNTMRLIHGIIFILSVKFPFLLYIDVVIGAFVKLSRTLEFKII